MFLRLLLIFTLIIYANPVFSQNVDSLTSDFSNIEYKTSIEKHPTKNVSLDKDSLKWQIKNSVTLAVVLRVIVILFFLILLVILIFNRKRERNANELLLIKNKEIEKQKEELEILNQQMFASNIKIDQQNIEVHRKNSEMELQKNELVKKTVDLLVLNRELRNNLKLREGLTNMIVHDLKNPISNIINLSENKEVKFFANEILTLVENILDVQKYEGVSMPLKKNIVSLNDIVINAIKQISLFAERKNIKIKNKISDSIIVNVDEEILRRVIVNFLSNSIKYSYVSSEIILDYEIVKENEVVIKIIDYGVGISKDKIHLIFNKFSQIMAKKTGSARSSGLGLTFCKMAVKSHGGEIIVESIPDKFTSFSFNVEMSNLEFNKRNKIIELNDVNDIIITNVEKTFLNAFYEEIKQCEVYEIGKLRKILKRINDNYSENISIWKKELNKAIYNCNSESYKELIKKIN